MPLTSAEKSKRYRQTHKDYWKIQYKRRYSNPIDHQKVIARKRVYEALKRGNLIRKPCFKRTCQNPKTEAHHYKGYAPKYALTVRFYCHLHHSQIEKQKNAPLT